MPSASVSPVDKTKTQHEGTEHLAINHTFVRRFLTLLALKTTARFYTRDGFCFPISKHRIVKTGPWVHLTEAATMKFVAENTSLPVPKVYCSFFRKKRAYIVMERIRGEEIPKSWKNLSEKSRQNILAQLKHMFQELRALKPPPDTGVESCTGGSLRDSRTLKYLAPEAFPGICHDYDSSIDVWATGVVFFEWPYGIPEPPAAPKPRNENEKVSNHEWRNWIKTWCQRLLDKLKNDEDDALVEILLRMIETKPRRRWSADRCLDRGWLVQEKGYG
jgi:serine/threonine protein kinase